MAAGINLFHKGGVLEGAPPNIETKDVPGVDDKVDVTFKIKERPSGSFNAGVSFGSYQALRSNSASSNKVSSVAVTLPVLVLIPTSSRNLSICLSQILTLRLMA